MGGCQRCKSERVVHISVKCSDMFWNSITDRSGYVPADMGIGNGDYVEFLYCMHCGQIQGTWPRPHDAGELNG